MKMTLISTKRNVIKTFRFPLHLLLLMLFAACGDQTAELEAVMTKAKSSVGICGALDVGKKFAKKNQIVASELMDQWENACLDEKVSQKTAALTEARKLISQGKNCAAKDFFKKAETPEPADLDKNCQQDQLNAAQTKIKKLAKEGDWCSAQNHSEKLPKDHRPFPMKKLKKECKASKDAIKFN